MRVSWMGDEEASKYTRKAAPLSMAKLLYHGKQQGDILFATTSLDLWNIAYRRRDTYKRLSADTFTDTADDALELVRIQ